MSELRLETRDQENETPVFGNTERLAWRENSQEGGEDVSVNYDKWQPVAHSDESRDQQRDLFGHYWAEVGPDNRRDPDGWSWTVLNFAEDNAEVAGGFTASEEDAKAAVRAWVVSQIGEPA